MMMAEFSALDVAAFGWLAVCWIGYTVLADGTRLRHRTVARMMDEYRTRWMMAMLQRELRIVDTSIVGSILHGVAFFSSTAILLVGGLLAALGATSEAMELLTELPFAAETTRAAWETKVILLGAVFIYAFFKLSWSFRLFVNCSVLIGAAPLPPVEAGNAERYAQCVGRALSIASKHYNAGMRAYFFALAAVWWFLNPTALIVATSVVVVVLYRREFHSKTLRTVREGLDLAGLPPAPKGTCSPAAAHESR